MADNERRILVVDPKRNLQVLLQAALTEFSAGTTVVAAPDGNAAVDLARTEDPQVIVLDLGLADAGAILRRMKSDPRLAAIPVLCLAAPKTPRDRRQEALQAGADGFVGLPFDGIELAAQLRAMGKIKAAGVRRRQEREDLAGLVAERTYRLEHELAERRRAEQALSASNERFLSLADNIPAYIANVNAETLRYEFVNIAFEKAFGIPRERIIGSHVKEVIGEENFRFAQQFIEMARQGQSVTYQNTFSFVAGRRWVEINYYPVAADGRITSIVVAGFDITARRQAEIALSESEARYRRITEGLADYQYTVRLERGQAAETVHSPACLFVTGYSAEEFAADPFLWLDMVTPDDRDMLIARVKQILAGQDIGPIEHKIVRKDGVVRWVSDNIVLNRDEAGVLRSYDGIVKDITERKQVEATNQMLLRETQDRYHEIAALMRASRAVLENPDFAATARVIWAECRRQLEAPAGFITLRADDAGTEVLLFDSGMAGGGPPERTPLPVTGLRADVYMAGMTMFTNKPVQNEEISFLAGGKEAAANMIVAPLPVGGKVMGLIGLIDKPGGFTGEDARIATGFGEIAALALAQSRNRESLVRSELRFRSLIETATDAIISVDGEGRITHWNSGAEKIFGYSAGEATGRNITLIVPAFMGEAEGGLKDEPAHGVLQQSCESREMTGQRRDGTWLPIELTVSRWQTREGVFFTVIIRDISERKQAEQAREKLQAQLNQAQKMEAIGVLAGGIAHDFNNILGAIIGYTEMAKEDAAGRLPLAEDLDKVLLAAHRAKDLVKQILGFSRQSAVARVPMKLLPLVKETLKMLRASIPSTITIKKNLQPIGQSILADPTQVHQIILNLCSNAAHAMESGGGLMTVAVQEAFVDKSLPLEFGRLLPGEYVLLSVSDTGTGIAPEVRARMFDPYFTTKEVGKGTGMGLSIIHGIIKSYGGAVSVDSVVGFGTTFHIYFPVVQEEEKREEYLPAPLPGKERILFVDDEEVLTRMGKIMLERLGYSVTVYNSSLDALAAFMKNPESFDLVVTDQTMPGMTGTDLARRLLQLAPGLPIILCTGFSNLVNEESAKLLGIKGFALKPLSKNVIGKLIRQVLHEE